MGCQKTTPRLQFAPNLFRACRTHFQLPQAILADCGNWLIPKRKALHAVRCLKAGDGSASQTRVLCLTLTLPDRDRRDANIFSYVIGIGRASATLVAIRLPSAPTACKPDFANTTRTHPTTPRQYQMHRNSSGRSSFRREGQKRTSSADCTHPQTPNMSACRVHILRSSGKPPYRRSLG